MPNRRQEALAAGNLQRVQGVSAETTVTSDQSILHTLTVTVPAAGSAASVDIQNGGTVVGTVEVGAGETVNVVINARFDSGIRLNPSATDIDALVAYS